jgi:mevalonate kinase
MSVTLGNLLYFIKMNNTEVKQKTAETAKVIQDLDQKFNSSRSVIKQWGQDFKNSVQQVRTFAEKNKEAIQSIAVISGAVFGGMALEIKKATKENIAFRNSMMGLQSVAKGTGNDINKVTQAATDLTKDGLMSISDAATSLKNLLQAGFGLDQAILLMNRFKDSAAFGRQGALSFGESIRGATEGIRNGNSILVKICPAKGRLLAA